MRMLNNVKYLIALAMLFCGCAPNNKGNPTVQAIEKSYSPDYKYTVTLSSNVWGSSYNFSTNEEFQVGDTIKLCK